MPRTPARTPRPAKSPTLSPRRSARIREQRRSSLESVKLTESEMAFRILSLESNVKDLEEKMENQSDSGSKWLSQVTVDLLTDGVEQRNDELVALKEEMGVALKELRKAKAQLLAANDDASLCRRREKEYIKQIDQLRSEKKDLTGRLEATVEQMNILKDKIEVAAQEKQELVAKYNALCGEYAKSVDMLEPLFRKMTPTKKDAQCSTPSRE